MGSNSRQDNLKQKNPPNERLHEKASSLLKWKDKFDSEWNLFQTTLEELKQREKRMGSKEKELEAKELELKSEYESKIWELDKYEKVIENRQKEMMSTEKQLKAKESKLKMEFELKGKQLEGIEKEIDVKRTQYKLLLMKIRENAIELDRINKCRKEGEEKLDLLERSIEQKTEEADTKEEEFQGMLKKYKNCIGLEEEKLHSIVKSFEEQRKELELKQEQIKASQTSILEYDKEIKLEEKELGLLQNSVEETLNELEMLQSRCDSLQRDVLSEENNLWFLKESVNQTAHELKEKQKEFEDWVKDHPKDVLPFEAAQPESLYDTNNGGSLDCSPSEHVKGNDFIRKINTDNVAQSNPAQLLNVMRESFYQHWQRIDNVGFEASFMKTFISLFEKLYSTIPEIQPLVKEDAMKLAVEWEKRMKATNENSLEVLGFLFFVSTYDLIFKFEKDAILKYLTATSQHENDLRSHPPLLECTCGLADGNRQECVAISHVTTKITCYLFDCFGKEARTLHTCLYVAEFIWRLIDKKDVFDAAKLICTLKLDDKFPVVPFRRKEIATRKVAALNAVKVHNLRSDSSFLKCDSLLEQKIEDEQQQEKQKKRRNCSLSPQDRSCKRALFSL